MALVAKVYEGYAQIGTAYTRDEDNKNYIDVLTEDGEIKSVRVYTIEQYNFLLGMQYQKDKMAEERRKVAESYNEERKINAGFRRGYIRAILGDTYSKKDQLKAMGAKFSTGFKWYFEGGTEHLYEGDFPTRKITWEEASEEVENGCIRLKPINELEKLVRVEVPVSNASQFRGILGDELKGVFELYERKIIDGNTGRHALNLIRDEQGNVCVWNTSIRDMPDYGIYCIKAIISGHKIYEGIRQTILSRVEVI